MTRILNEIDVDELNDDIKMLKNNPSRCQITQKLTAEFQEIYLIKYK